MVYQLTTTPPSTLLPGTNDINCFCSKYNPIATMKSDVNNEQLHECKLGFKQLLDSYGIGNHILQEDYERNEDNKDSCKQVAFHLELPNIDSFCGYPWDSDPFTTKRAPFLCGYGDDDFESCKKRKFSEHIKCEWFGDHCDVSYFSGSSAGDYCKTYQNENECSSQYWITKGHCIWYEKEFSTASLFSSCCHTQASLPSFEVSPWCNSIGKIYDKRMKNENSGYEDLSCHDVVGPNSRYKRNMLLHADISKVDETCCVHDEEDPMKKKIESSNPTSIPSKSKPSSTQKPSRSTKKPSRSTRNPASSNSPILSSSHGKSKKTLKSFISTKIPSQFRQSESPSSFGIILPSNAPSNVPSNAPALSKNIGVLHGVTGSPTMSSNSPASPHYNLHFIENGGFDDDESDSDQSSIILIASVPLLYALASYLWKSRNKDRNNLNSNAGDSNSEVENPTAFEHIDPHALIISEDGCIDDSCSFENI